MDTVMTFLLGLLLRLGLPIAVTILVIALLHRLDKRWQKQALALPVIPAGKPCWEIEDCPAKNREECPVPAHPGVPCWQFFRTKDGVMKEACLGCDVFRQAPLPVKV